MITIFNMMVSVYNDTSFSLEFDLV